MRIAVASDGTMAAIHEADRVAVVELPGCAVFSELPLDGNAAGTEVAWVGTPPRLIVLARYPTKATAQLIDPFGPRVIATLELEAPMKLVAAVGAYALAIGAHGASVLTATESQLTVYQFPARGVPIAAGAAGARFAVAFAGTLEEWDPQARIPQRRIKLPHPVTVTSVGGSDRVLWYTTMQDPSRVEVTALVARGQPKRHELPEPVAAIAGHARSDLLACVGADTGRMYVIDLDARAGMRVIGPSGIDRAETAALVIGRVNGVLAAQAGRPIAFVELGEGPPRPPTFTDEEDGSTELALPSQIGSEPGWREAITAWARGVAHTAADPPSPPDAPAIASVIARFELPQALCPAIALLYGAHLAGERGAAPIDVARVLGHRWEEALGRGQLAARGLALFHDSRIRLAPAIERELDDRA